MVAAEILPGSGRALPVHASDPDVLRFALGEAAERIASAARPVIVAGVELHRFGLQDALAEFAHATGIPVASTLGGKSVSFRNPIPPTSASTKAPWAPTACATPSSGATASFCSAPMMSDINLGVYTARIDRSASVYAGEDRVSVGFRSYDGASMEDFVRGLAKRPWTKRALPPFVHPARPAPFAASDRRSRSPPCFASSTPSSMTTWS